MPLFGRERQPANGFLLVAILRAEDGLADTEVHGDREARARIARERLLRHPAHHLIFLRVPLLVGAPIGVRNRRVLGRHGRSAAIAPARPVRRERKRIGHAGTRHRRRRPKIQELVDAGFGRREVGDERLKRLHADRRGDKDKRDVSCGHGSHNCTTPATEIEFARAGRSAPVPGWNVTESARRLPFLTPESGNVPPKGGNYRMAVGPVPPKGGNYRMGVGPVPPEGGSYRHGVELVTASRRRLSANR